MGKFIYVFGHQNPDTDSICSAIAYAHLKSSLGYDNVVAARLGAISRETNFALEKFGAREPRLITHIKPQVSDMKFYKVQPIYTVDSVKKAWDVMSANGRPMAPVLYPNHKLAGVITISDIAKAYIGLTDNTVLREKKTPFVNIPAVLDGKVITGEYVDPYVKGDVYTIASLNYGEELNPEDIVMTGNNKQLIEMAIGTNAGCVIVTGVDMDDPKVCIPENTDCAIIYVPHKFFKAVKVISQSIPVASLIKKADVTFFEIDDTIDEVKEVMLDSQYRHFPVINKEGEVEGIISKRHILDIQKKKVILVDHNERAQSALGIEQAEILEIVDHHRVANLDTQIPVFLRAEPVGCTCTIIAKMYQEANIMPPREIAGLMLSAILSDTLVFKSPTCTEEDKKIAKRLAKIAEVDLEAYGEELISVGGALDKLSPKEILEGDCKSFIFGDYKAMVSQVNTTSLRSLESVKVGVIYEMERTIERENVDLAILIVTDILLGGSQILAVGPAKVLAESAFGIEPDKDSIYLDGVCSRKKQIVPQLTMAAQNK
ncbi:MAG: pyrophosphatase [Epulopiscium sp. Nuni2H_MBin001]|nr:MAG: pyrophosphatase [Epulopiscium sp. Nuni2H_MBin001]